MSEYRIGIEASKNFIEEAKTKGVYIIYDQYRCFYHNVELWYIWLYRSGITNINIVTTTKDIQKDYLCIIIAHLFSECPSNKYIAIQTEDLVQKKYIVEKLCMNACAIWDYSKSNIEFLKNNYNMQYFGELIEHYVHCILCINTLINNQLNNNPYVLNIFRTNINYTPITGSLFLTKPIKYYLDTSNQEYFEKLSEYENEVINYLEIISYLLKNLSPEKLKLHNDIINL